MKVACPRCGFSVEWEYEQAPSKGWICQFCREELNMKVDVVNDFAESTPNDLEERRLDEDYDGDSRNILEEKILKGRVEFAEIHGL